MGPVPSTPGVRVVDEVKVGWVGWCCAGDRVKADLKVVSRSQMRNDQRSDLERQLGRLVAWSAVHGLAVSQTVAEVGSGMNGSRPKLRRLLADQRVSTIVVEHRDRLARLGSEYIEAALLGAGRRLVVVETSEVEDDLVRDMTEVLTSLCARLYGRRSARTRAQRALRCAAATPEVA